MACRALDAEFSRHLVAPLADQGGRAQDQHALGHAAQDVFLQHHPGLDGLAEPDLVGQQHPAAILLEHLADGFGLIPVRLNALQRRQAEQFVEPLEQTQPHKFTTEGKQKLVLGIRVAGDFNRLRVREVKCHIETGLLPRQIRNRGVRWDNRRRGPERDLLELGSLGLQLRGGDGPRLAASYRAVHPQALPPDFS